MWRPICLPNYRESALQRVQEDFVMSTVNNAAKFNWQTPVIDPATPCCF